MPPPTTPVEPAPGAGGTPATAPPAGMGGDGMVEPPVTEPPVMPGDFARPVGTVPNAVPAGAQINDFISPDFAREPYGIYEGPSVVNGYLVLAGEGDLSMWDISDPTTPQQISAWESEYSIYGPNGIRGEAESHQIAFAKRGTNMYSVSITGRGIMFADISDPTAPAVLSDLVIPGISYGDVTEAIWGVFWQGDFVYVGATNRGLFVVDASDPSNPAIGEGSMSTGDYGGFSSGPIFAIGNLLVVTPPKNLRGIATLDISNPAIPQLLDSNNSMSTTYIGGFFNKYVWFLEGIRAWDVTTDPMNITQVGPNMDCGSKGGCDVPTPDGEYMVFADDHMFMGQVRNTSGPGVTIFNLSDMSGITQVRQIEGRRTPGSSISNEVRDDQFSLPVGPFIVFCEDEEPVEGGCIIALYKMDPDTAPPVVHYVNPPDGSTAPTTSRIGWALSDQIELATLNEASVIVRPMGGEPIAGQWSVVQTVVNFTPAEPLQPQTTYEVILPAGGVTDIVGNAIAADFRSTFTTR